MNTDRQRTEKYMPTKWRDKQHVARTIEMGEKVVFYG